MDWKSLCFLATGLCVLLLLMLRSSNSHINRLTQRRWIVTRSYYVLSGTEDEPVHTTSVNSFVCFARDQEAATSIFLEWEKDQLHKDAVLAEVEISEITLN